MKIKFATREICAIDERALGGMFESVDRTPANVDVDGVCIVSVRGPLMHHQEHGQCFDSYDGIKARVASAIATSPRAIVLSIDSPGGLVSGCFDTADEISAICKAARIPLFAYIDGQACSAAYALACVADAIAIPPTAEAGSIGCVADMTSVAKIEAAMGIDHRIIMSGERKADGNPSLPITDEAEATLRGKVMMLAGIFAQHVAQRRQVPVEDVMAMQAGIVIGANAVPMLADFVMGQDEMLAAIAAGTFAAPVAAETEQNMTIKAGAKAEDKDGDKDYEAAISTLRKRAEAGDERAKRMLKAELEEEEATAEAEPKKDDEEKPAASAEAPPPPKKDDEEKPASKAELAAIAARLDARDAADTKAKAEADASERTRLIASRPDFDAATQTMCAKLSLPDLREYVKTAEQRKPKTALARIAASTVVGGTRAAGQVDAAGTGAVAGAANMRQSEADARAMRVVMGTEPMPAHAVHISEDGNLTIGQLYQPKPGDFDQRRLERGVREPK